MAQAKQQQPFGDAFKAFGDFKFPNINNDTFDINSLVTAQRKNLEALSQANQALLAGAQEVARRQAQIVQDNVQAVLHLVKEVIASGGNPEVSTQEQTKFAREFVESGLNDARELAEIASKSGNDAYKVLNERIAQFMSEIADTASSVTKKDHK